MLKKLLFFCLIFLFFQCGEESVSNNESDNHNEQIKDPIVKEKVIDYLELDLPEKPVIVERIYATTTNIPLKENSIYKAFDNDINTNWQSMPGATTNEGILIAFAEKTYVKSFVLDAKTDQEFVYYVNGSLVDKRWGKTGKSKSLNTKVSTIFLKFKGNNDKVKSFEPKDDEVYLTYRATDPDETISISEINFYGKGDDKLNLVLPYMVDGTVTTSSNLKSSDSYKGDNLFDNMREYAWVEGAEGNGIGEKVTFNTQKGLKINSIKIWNGYQRSPSHHYSNAKLKTFDFTTGELTENNEIRNSETSQVVNFENTFKGDEFILKITDAFDGNSYEDLAISEITFYQNQYPIKIRTNAIEKTIKANKENPDLWFLDRGFESTHEEGAGAIDISMNIRSNGTFVYYKDEYCGPYCYEIIDGNWELIESDEDKAKIMVYGKIFRPSASEEMYQGKMNMNSVKIFKDQITITKKSLQGQKFIEEIKFP